jgi:hypothetical protein
MVLVWRVGDSEYAKDLFHRYTQAQPTCKSILEAWETERVYNQGKDVREHSVQTSKT